MDKGGEGRGQAGRQPGKATLSNLSSPTLGSKARAWLMTVRHLSHSPAACTMLRLVFGLTRSSNLREPLAPPLFVALQREAGARRGEPLYDASGPLSAACMHRQQACR